MRSELDRDYETTTYLIEKYDDLPECLLLSLLVWHTKEKLVH